MVATTAKKKGSFGSLFYWYYDAVKATVCG